MKQARPTVWQMLRQTGEEFSEDGALSLSAALAYYSIFSIAPLLVIAVAIAGTLVDANTVNEELGSFLKQSLGPGSFAVEEMVKSARRPATNVWVSLGGIAMLLFGASGVFGQLQEALNTVWGVKRRDGRGIGGFLKDRFLSFAMVLGTGFLLLVSMLLTASLEGAAKYAASTFDTAPAIVAAMGTLVTFLVVWGLFAAIFKVLPDAVIRWRDVVTGSLVTAALFVAGKFAISWYLGREATASAYGAAGSLALVLLWVYYSSIILLFGAEFTQVRANASGRAIQPDKDAVAVGPPVAKEEDAATERADTASSSRGDDR